MTKKLCIFVLAFLIAVQTILGSYGIAESAGSRGFIDAEDHWAKREITALYDKGFIKGTPVKGGFEVRPEALITRAEFLSVIVKIKGYTQDKNNGKIFKDIADNAWYKPVVETAAGNGLINGYPDGTFNPEGKITRAEIALIIAKAGGFDKEALNPDTVDLKDVKDGDWFAGPVKLCKSKEIVKGFKDGTFKPHNYAKRAEAFVMLWNLYDMLSKKETTVKPEETIPGFIPKPTASNASVDQTLIMTITPAATPTSTPISAGSGGGGSGGNSKGKSTHTPVSTTLTSTGTPIPSVAPTPEQLEVVKAEALNLKELKVRFNKVLNEEQKKSALDIKNYEVYNEESNLNLADGEGSSIELGDNGSAVILMLEDGARFSESGANRFRLNKNIG